MALHAACFHLYRFEMLAVRLEPVTIRAVERLTVASTQHLLRIEVLLVRELEIRLLGDLALPRRDDLGMPFEDDPGSGFQNGRLKQLRLEFRMAAGAEAVHRVELDTAEIVLRLGVAIHAQAVAGVDEERRGLVVLAMAGRAALRRTQLRHREPRRQDVILDRLVTFLAGAVAHLHEQRLVAGIATFARRLLVRRAERTAAPELIRR